MNGILLPDNDERRQLVVLQFFPMNPVLTAFNRQGCCYHRRTNVPQLAD